MLLHALILNQSEQMDLYIKRYIYLYVDSSEYPTWALITNLSVCLLCCLSISNCFSIFGFSFRFPSFFFDVCISCFSFYLFIFVFMYFFFGCSRLFCAGCPFLLPGCQWILLAAVSVPVAAVRLAPRLLVENKSRIMPHSRATSRSICTA